MKETSGSVKLQLARYMQDQSETMQGFHRWMKRLEGVSIILIAASFILALTISILWERFDPRLIAVAWFAFAASAGPLILLNGLHAIVLRAFPAGLLPGVKGQFATGSKAVFSGAATMTLGCALATFWGFFAYATWTQNEAMLEPLIALLGTLMGVAIAASILFSMAQKIFKFS